jgi:hypothetical protein
MLSLPSTSTQKDDGSKRGQYYLGLIERRRGSIGLNSKDGDESRLGISALEVGTDLLRGGLDCGNKIVVREGVFGDKFVERDSTVGFKTLYRGRNFLACVQALLLGWWTQANLGQSLFKIFEATSTSQKNRDKVQLDK